MLGLRAMMRVASHCLLRVITAASKIECFVTPFSKTGVHVYRNQAPDRFEMKA